jgi:hypothetical protein
MLLSTQTGLAFVPPENTQEKNLLPEKDAYVDSADPNKNLGAEKNLSLSFTHSSKILFMKFNLADLTAKPKKATVSLFLNQSAGKQEPINAEILLPSNSWKENEISWNNKPSLYKTELAASFEATPGAQTIDITPIFNKWQDGTIKNYGLALYSRDDTFERIFSSKEGSNPPTLILSSNQEYEEKKEAINSEALEIFSLEEKVKTASDAATISALKEEQQKEEDEEKKEETKNPSQASVISSKYSLILGLALLAVISVAIEKFSKDKKQTD